MFSFLLWISLQSGCGSPKEFYSFHLHRCATCKKFRDFFLSSNFINLLQEFIAFLLCSLIISSSVCYGEIRELHA